MCDGEVKPSGVHPKNPAQHAEDILMLSQKSVDGAGDEGPAVQFWCTLHHLEAPTKVTLVTARSSGSFYLNRV